MTKPRTPQTNGMVERFNGRISDVLQSHHFVSGEDVAQTLCRYALLYNQQLPQSTLGSKTPLDAMQRWYASHPHLFVKRPCNLAGGDTYALRQEYIDRTINLEAKDALKTPISQSYAAITDPQQLGALIRAMRAYQGGFIVKAALQLSALLFVRPGELRLAQWGEFDLDAALWTIPAARMKRDKQGKEGKEGGAPHFVPLPKQAVAILKSLHTYTGNRPFVFPSLLKRDRTINVRNPLRLMSFQRHGGGGYHVSGNECGARRPRRGAKGVVSLLQIWGCPSAKVFLARFFSSQKFYLLERFAWARFP